VKVAKVRSSDLVVVVGIGGLGHMAVQYARIAGATVVAVDVREDKLQLARDLGATYAINATVHDPVAEIKQLGGADAVIVLAASAEGARQAYDYLKRGGRLVFVGLPHHNEVPIPIFETVLNAITVTGSIVGTRLDLAETFELHASGLTRVVTERRRLEQVNESFEDVLAGNVPARIVFDMAA
jgi:alcohol dehydrogenase, propanol-preferring